MKKESFVKIINALIAENDKEEAFNKAIKEFFTDPVMFAACQDLQDELIKVLEYEMDDPAIDSEHGSIISWWLFDAPQAGHNISSAYILENGKEFVLETPEQLYDYLKLSSRERNDEQ